MPVLHFRSHHLLALVLSTAACGGESPPDVAAAPAADVAAPPAEAAPTEVPAVAEGAEATPDATAVAPAAVGSPSAAVPNVVPTPAAATPGAPPSAPPSASPTSAAPTAAAPAPTATAASTPSPTEAPVAAAAPVPTVATYTLDAGKSALYVQVFKDGDTLASGLSHDHVVAATGWSGTVRWDPADPAACKVDITVPVSGLRPDEDGMRKRVGYDVMLEPDQREEVKGNMLSAGQLNSKSFTDIKFVATKCEAAGEKVKVSGNLTVRGKAAPVTSTMKLTADGASLTATGTFTAKATDFGFDPYSALLGALKNKNEMKFTVDAKGTAK